MLFISPDLEIKIIDDLEDINCMHFVFKGKFSVATSISASACWSNLLSENPNIHYDFIWDCTQMTGFELQARKEWYNAIQKHKNQIKKVYVISDKLMIRSAAKVMLQFFGIKSQIARSNDNLEMKILL